MKITLLSLLLLCTCVLAAQTGSRSITESSNEENYSFSVKFDKQNAAKLLPIYQELTNTKLKIKGDAVTEWDNDLTLSLNTRKGKLSVVHAADDLEGRASALRMVAVIKERLKINPPPATPKH